MTDAPTPRRKRSELKHEDEIALVHTLEPWGRLKNIGDRIQMLTDCTTPTPQPDLSDEGLRHLVRMLVACGCEEADCVHCNRIYGSIRSVRDQARATERKKTLLWVADEIDSALSGALKSLTAKMVQHRDATGEGGNDVLKLP